MKILLIQPPVEDFYDTDIRLEPVGLGFLRAAIRFHLPHLDVKIVDFHHGWGRRTIPLPLHFSYLERYFRYPDQSPFSTFHHYNRYGASTSQMEEVLLREKPDLVGISSPFTAYFSQALETAITVKRVLSCPVLFGGAHPSSMPVETLGNKEIDFLILGEGEKPLVMFLKFFEKYGWENMNLPLWSEVPNLCYKIGDRIVTNPKEPNYPIDSIPVPDWEDHGSGKYLLHRKPCASIVLSRGCPWGCTFCSVESVFSGKYRMRSVEGVLSEMEYLYQQGVRIFNFEDDNLNFRNTAFQELCLGISQAFRERDIELLAMNGLSHFHLNPDILIPMWQAGFHHLDLSLVSVNESLLKKHQRPSHTSSFEPLVRHAFDLGFSVTTYLILGLPGDTMKSQLNSLVFTSKLPTLIGPSVFYRAPGCVLYPKLKIRAQRIENGVGGQRPSIVTPVLDQVDTWHNAWARSTALIPFNPHFSREDLFTLLVCSRILNFLKSWKVPAGETLHLNELYSHSEDEHLLQRKQSGLHILDQLLKRNTFFVSVAGKYEPQPLFNSDLFHRLWGQLDFIGTQSGGRILTRS